MISKNAQRHQQDYPQPVVQESGASGGWADSIDKLLEDRRQAIEGSSGEILEYIFFIYRISDEKIFDLLENLDLDFGKFDRLSYILDTDSEGE